MDAPTIQYARASDGVTTAFCVQGEGPLVIATPLLYHGIQNTQRLAVRNWYDDLAQVCRLVRYDRRGTGLSERNVTDFGIEAHIRDLDAVAEKLGAGTFALFAGFLGGPVAIAYAVRHPERVTHLITWNAYARGADYLNAPEVQASIALLETSWEMYTETQAQFIFSWTGGRQAHDYASLIREDISQKAMHATYKAVAEYDASRLLSRVHAPTLVIHVRGSPYPPTDVSRELAAAFPDARLVVFEQAQEAMGLPKDPERAARAVADFLRSERDRSHAGTAGAEAQSASGQSSSGTAVILFTDIVESTALTERLGDAAFRTKARDLDAALRTVVREAGGTPVEGTLLGDGLLAVFTSARHAIDCALRCHAAARAAGLELHVGVHAGDVIREGNNVFGGSVNLAARIRDAAAPGEVLVSDIVRGLARTSARVTFLDRGDHALKGIAEPVRLFEVRGQ